MPERLRLEDLPLRADLRGRSPYGAPQLNVPVRLNTNENAWRPPAEVVAGIEKAVAGVLSDLNRYPDRDAVALREDLAGYLGHGLDVSNVWAANGSNEVQQQLLQAFGGPGHRVLGFTPSYSMHPLLALGTGTRWIDGARWVDGARADAARAQAGRPSGDFTIDPDVALAQIAEHQPELVFLCSPDNPTGVSLSIQTLQAVLRVAPGLVVVDEAYVEFARTGAHTALELMAEHPRLVVTRTMSKAFGFAGARLGYLAAQPAVVDALQLVRLPYHLSALTQAAARAALAHADALLGTVESIKQERDLIVAGLRDLGLTVPPSDANFALFGEFADQRAVWQALLRRGVLVRDVGLAGWLRVTAGTPEESSAFLEAIADVITEAGTGLPAAGLAGSEVAAGAGPSAGSGGSEFAAGAESSPDRAAREDGPSGSSRSGQRGEHIR